MWVHLYENYMNLGTGYIAIVLCRSRQVAERAALQRQQSEKHLQREVEAKCREGLLSPSYIPVFSFQATFFFRLI